jgi:hypothetical protein
MINQVFPLLALLLFPFVSTAQTIQKKSADTTAYRANDRLKTSGPINGWPSKTGNPDPSGFWFTIQAGASSASVKNIPFYLKPKSGWLAGAGIELLLIDRSAGRMPIGLHYQISAFSIQGTDPASGEKITNDLQMQYLKLPLQYQLYIDRSKRLFIGGGGYTTLLLKTKQTGTILNVEKLNRAEFGVMLSAGYSLSTRWVLQANAQWGLTSIDEVRAGAQLDKNRFYFLSLLFSPFAAANGKPKYGPVLKIKPQG